jgi:TolB-like protein/DNA-binding winged helix-turn-helix (wHTH) protein/lipoprotein NlpI
MTRAAQASSLCFGPYEINLESGDLRKYGYRIRLQPKSFLVLRALLERPGEFVTREELRAQLWSQDTFVEFESSLNVAVRRLRQALNDEAQNPIYVETKPRHGYRFIAVVEAAPSSVAALPGSGEAAASLPGAEDLLPASPAPNRGLDLPLAVPPATREWAWNSWKTIATALALLIAMAGGVFLRKHAVAKHSPAAVAPSIAVLPFVDASPGKTQEYFSDGLAEELLNELATTPGLRVAARTSSFQFKAGSADLRAIGEKLHVATVLQGRVSEDGNHVRINTELINVDDGLQLWSGSYERDLKGIFAVQDEIAHAVAAELKVKLLSRRPPASPPRRTSIAVYDDYLQGRYFSERRTQADLERAANYYEQAIKLDPNYAPAWSGLAWTRMSQATAGYGVSFDQGASLARQAAQQALQLDPNLAEAHAALGWVQRSHDWDWPGADASFQKALALEPQNPMVLLGASHLAAALGRLPDALALNRSAVELDPLSVTAHIYLGLHAYSAGHLDLAADAYRKALEINPDDPDAHYLLSLVDLQRGQPAQALVELDKEDRDLERWVGQSLAYAALGRRPESDQVLAKIVATSPREAAYQIAEVYAYRGENDLAFHWLERAWSQRDMGLPGFQNDPLLKSLHADARYSAFLKKMRLD